MDKRAELINKWYKRLLLIVQVVFITLKLSNVVAWGWMRTLLPLIIHCAIVLLLFAILGFINVAEKELNK